MWKLLIKKGEIKFFMREDGNDMTWEKKSDCTSFKMCLEGLFDRLLGYSLEEKEVN
jgi:hypothetical protein